MEVRGVVSREKLVRAVLCTVISIALVFGMTVMPKQAFADEEQDSRDLSVVAAAIDEGDFSDIEEATSLSTQGVTDDPSYEVTDEELEAAMTDEMLADSEESFTRPEVEKKPFPVEAEVEGLGSTDLVSAQAVGDSFTVGNVTYVAGSATTAYAMVAHAASVSIPKEVTNPGGDRKKYTVIGVLLELEGLTSINLTACTGLQWAFLGGNRLTTLDVSKNTKLTTLSCYGNKLTKLNVSKNIALTYLDCSINNLTALDISKNTKIKSLYTYWNYIGNTSALVKRATKSGCTGQALPQIKKYANGMREVLHISGATRYDTAAQEAISAYPYGSNTVIIAGGEEGRWPDALSASGLAGVIQCPILLTASSSLSPEAQRVITALGASEAIVIGGSASISDRAYKQIKASLPSDGKISRLGGQDRFDTANLIYQSGYYKSGGKYWGKDGVIIASGNNFPDALSISALAFSKKMPVFLTNNANIDNVSLVWVNSIKPKQVIIAGGAACVNSRSASKLKSIAKVTPIRLSGDNRYSTGAKIAKWCVTKGYLKWNGAAFASGKSPYDALAGGALQGRSKSVLLLTDSNTNTNVSDIRASRSSVGYISFLGGTAAVSQGYRNAVIKSLGWA